jgi:hypothetical protein
VYCVRKDVILVFKYSTVGKPKTFNVLNITYYSMFGFQFYAKFYPKLLVHNQTHWSFYAIIFFWVNIFFKISGPYKRGLLKRTLKVKLGVGGLNYIVIKVQNIYKNIDHTISNHSGLIM